MREINSIQYLRGLAATAVFLYHLSESFGGSFKVGAAGVDVFFVISGFIMYVTTAGKDWTPQQFMMRRISRIVPLYWIVTGVTALAIVLKPQFLYNHTFTVTNLVGSLFFVPEVKSGGFHPIVIQGWTLEYEMFFYFLFAATLLVRERWRLWLVSAALAVFALLQPMMPDGPLRTLADPIIFEFAAGAALGWLWVSSRTVPLPLGMLLLVSGLVLFAVVDSLAPQLPRFLRWGAPALMVVSGSVFAERARPMGVVHYFKLLGDASYSIYLWHVVVVAVLQGIFMRIGLPLTFHILLVGVLTLPATILLYFLIEKPIVGGLRTQVIARRRASPK